MNAPAHARGFTLIEVLVSVFLLAVLSAFAYGTLNYVVKARTITSSSFARLREVELAVHTIVNDFKQVEPRPVRDLLGDVTQPALLADPRNTDLVALTRGGWSNNAGLQRGTLQRVVYRLDQGTLVREYQAVLDATLSDTPIRRELLKDVTQITIRYMDSTRAWQTQWPAASAAGSAAAPVALRDRPKAVEVVIDLKDIGTLRRVIEVPG
jgi:general secretion pathway protein J